MNYDPYTATLIPVDADTDDPQPRGDVLRRAEEEHAHDPNFAPEAPTEGGS
jgi:hypothetical protein